MICYPRRVTNQRLIDCLLVHWVVLCLPAAVDLMVSGDHEKSKALVDSDNLRQSIVHLQQLVGQAQQYVEAVVVSRGEGEGVEERGRG